MVVTPVFPASGAGRPAIGAGITRVVRQRVGVLQQEARHQQAVTRRRSDAGELIVVAAINKAAGYVCSGPEIISRGFVYVRENEDLIDNARKVVCDTLDGCHDKGVKDWNMLKNAVRSELKNFIYEKTKRSPIILPIFLEV